MLLSAALALQSTFLMDPSNEPPPNIVFILADDLGYGELGCYGQEKIQTPNIDRLAAEGTLFTQFYSASPVCAPTRCSLMTGKHQGHAAIRGNKEQGSGPMGPEGQFPLPPSETTVAESLRRLGYRTGIFGKWGLGGSAPGQNPLDHGFDRFYGYLCQRRAHTHYPTYLWDDYNVEPLEGNTVFNPHQAIQEPLNSEREYQDRFGGRYYAPERTLQKALEFIRRKEGRPYFLYYATPLPHLALQAPQEWIDRYPREWDTEPYLGGAGYLPAARPRATYAAMISYFDHSVGEIVREVDRQGQGGRTLFVVTSDNGATFASGVDREFFNSNGGFRGAKMSLYEGGIRVPFIARWTGQVPAGRRTGQVATMVDVSATLQDVAGSPRVVRGDGRSFASLLLGGKEQRREAVYFEYPEAGGWQAVLLRGRYKAVRAEMAKGVRTEVYDLLQDPSEKTDLASQRPDLVRRAEAVMRKEHRPNRDFPLPGIDTPAKTG